MHVKSIIKGEHTHKYTHNDLCTASQVIFFHKIKIHIAYFNMQKNKISWLLLFLS